MASLADLAIAVLAVWRVTHLLWGEDGPWKVFAGFRRAAGHGFWGGLLDCFYCLSLWPALPIAMWLGLDWPARVLIWFALSGGAILLQRVTTGAAPPPTPQWHVESSPEP